jgi:septal ring factor EnvC (AmiA/AmiB activator)
VESEESESQENKSPRINFKAAIPGAIAAFLIAVTSGASHWVLDKYEDLIVTDAQLLALINDNAVCCQSFREYQKEDSEQRHYWVGVIDIIRTRLRELTVELAKTQAENNRFREKISELKKEIERVRNSLPQK